MNVVLDVLSDIKFFKSKKCKFFFLKGSYNPSSAKINNIIKSLFSTKKNLIVSVPLENGEFKKFNGFKALITLLLPFVSNNQVTLLKKYKEYLLQIVPEVYGRHSKSTTNLADSIILAVVRRISRESHHSALLIDSAARFTLELLERHILPKYSTITFLLPDFDNWDRPSLRILNRINKLSMKNNINWVAFTTYIDNVQNKGNNELIQKFIDSRILFLEYFKSVQGYAKLINLPIEKAERGSLLDLGDKNTTINIHEVGEDLAFQNYERVYLVLKNVLENLKDKEVQSQVYRLIALADASRGDFQGAYSFLSKAYTVTNQATLRAHLKYLQGLICTKRYYDLDRAGEHYNEGLECLQRGKLGKSNKAFLLEKAWLLNGQALIHALRAKSLSGKKVQEEIKKSFSLEIEAYKIAKIGKGPNFSYLRHNLLANITFLLEINLQYNQAIVFWRKAFERYLASENPSFEVAFNTRLGLLQFKAGKTSESLSSLDKALKACGKIKDPFYQERIYYALGYVQYKTDLFSKSLESFVKGLEITFNLREWTNFFGHLNGALYSSALMKDKKLFMELHEFGIGVSDGIGVSKYKYLKKKFDSSDLSRVLQKAKIELMPPEPKLSSYIPSVDLEGAPAQDLNRYLVDEKRHALNKNIFTKN